MSEHWRLISTAPMDGTVVRLRRVYRRIVIAIGTGYFGTVTIRYDEGPKAYEGVWVDADSVHFFPTPTHWMPAKVSSLRD